MLLKCKTLPLSVSFQGIQVREVKSYAGVNYDQPTPALTGYFAAGADTNFDAADFIHQPTSAPVALNNDNAWSDTASFTGAAKLKSNNTWAPTGYPAGQSSDWQWKIPVQWQLRDINFKGQQYASDDTWFFYPNSGYRRTQTMKITNPAGHGSVTKLGCTEERDPGGISPYQK